MVGENDVTPYPPVTVVPPLSALYQSIVIPFGTVALKVTVPEPQSALLLGLVGVDGNGFTVPVTVSRVADTQVVFVLRACA
jgi:hypothetical protein